MSRVLVAGVGNVFESDDGFGSGVVARVLESRRLDSHQRDEVEVRDFGIRGVHLAYQLLEGYELVVIVDAVARGGEPGTVYVIEHAADAGRPAEPMLDAHDLAPDEVLALVPTLGGTLGRVVVVGCEPLVVAPGMGLSEPVARSVDRAVSVVVEIVHDAAVTRSTSASAASIGGG